MTRPDAGEVPVLRPLSTSQACQVHKTHSPRSHVNERHHIWPQGENGPTVPENMVVVCATGHNNIHQLISMIKKAGGELPPSTVLRTFAAEEIRLAKLGYQRSIDQHL